MALVKGKGEKRGMSQSASQQRPAASMVSHDHSGDIPLFTQSALRREKDGTDWQESSLRARWHYTQRTHIGQGGAQHQWAWPYWPRNRPPRRTANDAVTFI